MLNLKKNLKFKDNKWDQKPEIYENLAAPTNIKSVRPLYFFQLVQLCVFWRFFQSIADLGVQQNQGVCKNLGLDVKTCRLLKQVLLVFSTF